MTLYHFGNCLALLYAPYHMAYKFSGISEYATFSKCLYAGGIYIFTQLCKMLVLATFFPDTDYTQNEDDYDIFLELLKSTVDIADLVGMYFALNSIPGKGHAKILTAAIGWAAAEAAVTRGVPLWTGARGAEFSWRHVRACADSNVALVQHAAAAALVWLWARSDVPRGLRPALATLLAATPFRVPLLTGLGRALLLGPWPRLLLRAAAALGSALAALALHAHLPPHA